MFAKTFSALAIVSAAIVAAQDIQVPTPPVANQCQPLQISWQGGQPPYYPTIISPNNPSDVIDNLQQYQGTQDSKISGWKVSVPQGQQFAIYVSDSTGAHGASAGITVGPGSDSCLNGKGGGAGAGGAGGAAGGSSSKSSGDNNSSSKSSGDNSSSQQSSSQSSSQQSSKQSSSSKPTSSSGADGAAGGASSSPAAGASSVASRATNGAATFSGVPAVVAGVVGAVVAALI